MRCMFTKHVIDKLRNLKISRVKITRKLILSTIEYPEDVNSEEDYPNLIASAKLDVDRVIRVVYRIEDGRIVIITFYPAKKGRYY